MASLDQAVSGQRFFALKIFMALFGFLLFIVFAAMDNALSGLLLGVAFAFYPTLWLKQIVARRHLSILKALPNVLDLLTLSVEAGKDFLTALRDIMARRKVDPLGEELNRVLHEIQLGKTADYQVGRIPDERCRTTDIAGHGFGNQKRYC